jgi:hypothetical protein
LRHIGFSHQSRLSISKIRLLFHIGFGRFGTVTLLWRLTMLTFTRGFWKMTAKMGMTILLDSSKGDFPEISPTTIVQRLSDLSIYKKELTWKISVELLSLWHFGDYPGGRWDNHQRHHLRGFPIVVSHRHCHTSDLIWHIQSFWLESFQMVPSVPLKFPSLSHFLFVSLSLLLFGVRKILSEVIFVSLRCKGFCTNKSQSFLSVQWDGGWKPFQWLRAGDRPRRQYWIAM